MATAKKAPAKALKKTGKTVMVRDMAGKDVELITLPDNIFSVKASDRLIAQYVRVYLANQRQGTASSKTRSEVNATTKKVYRQKGTGRARHGARTAALFVGGGVTFGPKPRDFSLKLNKKQVTKALYYSLSMKAEKDMLHILDGFAGLEHKTKASVGALNSLGFDKKVLIVYAPGQAEHLRKQLRNLKTVSSSQDRLLNAYKVLRADNVVFTKEGFHDFLTFRNGEQKIA